MERTTYFYHATSAEYEAKIKEDSILKPQVHNPTEEWMWLVNHRRDLVPNGVWFCATLYNGDLPDRSPYGNRRVRIPIASVIEQLGGNVKLYSGVTNQKVGWNTYVRLMFVKEGDNLLVKEGERFEILNHMKLQDIKENDWFTVDGECRVASRPIWVEIYIPYPIDVSGCLWDSVLKI